MKTQLYPDHLYERMLKHYVCAGCWRDLRADPQRTASGKRLWRLYCVECGDGRGLHSRAYVERERSENAMDAFSVRQMLEGAGVVDNPHADKTADELIQELGF